MAKHANVKSAQRVFEILEYFERSKSVLRLKDVVTELGYPPSSVTALLKTMADRRYLTFDRDTRSYFPTTRLAQLLSWMPTASFEKGPVLQTMENLRRSTQEMVVLGAPNDIYVEYAEALRSPPSIQLWIPPGTRWSMIQIGMGWLFLSRMPQTAVTRIYERAVALKHIHPKQLSRQQLLARIAKVRNDDVLFTSQADFVKPVVHPGGSMVATLIPTPIQRRLLGIAVGGPVDRIKENLKLITRELRKERTRLAEVLANEYSASLP